MWEIGKCVKIEYKWRNTWEQASINTIEHRKPDIFIIDGCNNKIIIIEVTVCYDLYIEIADQEKQNRYQPLKVFIENEGYSVQLLIMVFGSLGTITNKSRNIMKKLQLNNDITKSVLKWCSISNIIGANYIWRNRCKNNRQW